MKIAELFAELGLEINKESFEKGSELIEGVHHALEALAVFEGVKMLGEWVEGTAEAADKAVKLAQKLGTTAESVQELGYAAELSDVPIEQLQGGMVRLAKGMEEAAKTGKGPVVDAMHKLGLSMSDAEFKSGDLTEQLMHIADGFADMPDGAEKTAAAVALFGRSGADLIPMLNAGRDGIGELREEARALGVVIDEESAKKFEEFNDDVRRVKAGLTGLKNEAVVALLPMLQKAVAGMMAWIKANREWLKAKIEQVVHALYVIFSALVRVIGVAVKILSELADIVQLVVEAFNDLMGSADAVEDLLVGAAIAVGAAWLLANLPLIAMLAAIAAIILVVQDLWSWMNGGDSVLKNLYEAFVQYLGESGAGRVVLGIIHAIHAVVDAAIEGVTKLTEAGEWLGRKAAFYHQRNVHDEEIREMNKEAIAAGELTDEQIRAQAEALAANDVANTIATERAEENRVRNLVVGAGTVPAAGVGQTPIDPWSHAPVGGASTSVHAPVTINLSGVAGNPNEIAGTIAKALDSWWGDTMRDTAHATGARGGRLP